MGDICRICRINEADSLEHLVASAIGGRRKVPGVLCKTCNNNCGKTIDAGLAEQYAAIRMALGIEGDRGQFASIKATDAAGRKVYLDPGMQVRAAQDKPQVTEIETPNGKTFSVRVFSKGAAAQYVESLKKKHPGRTISINEVAIDSTYPDRVTLSPQIAGHDVIRSCVKSALTFIAYRKKPETGLELAWRYVGDGPPTHVLDAFLTSAQRPWSLKGTLGPVPHLIAVAANRADRSIRFQMRLFGDIAFCGTLAKDVDTATWKIGYAVDPLTGDEETNDTFTGQLGRPSEYDDQLFQTAKAAMERIFQYAYDRSMDASIKAIIHRGMDKHLKPLGEGALITAQAVAGMSKQIAEEFVDMKFRRNRRTEDTALLNEMRDLLNKKEPPKNG